MEIFKTANFLTEIRDYLSINSVKLGQLSYLQAARERWFQFEMASLIMDRWERLLNKPFKSWHLYAEVKPPNETSPIDLVVAPEKDDEIQWTEAGIIELKQVNFSLYDSEKKPEKKFIDIKRQIESDFKKREHLSCEMITIVLAHHPVSDEQEKNPNIHNIMESNLKDFRDYMKGENYCLPKNSLTIPSVYSLYRGENYGFYSCGIWQNKIN